MTHESKGGPKEIVEERPLTKEGVADKVGNLAG